MAVASYGGRKPAGRVVDTSKNLASEKKSQLFDSSTLQQISWAPSRIPRYAGAGGASMPIPTVRRCNPTRMARRQEHTYHPNTLFAA